MRSLCQENWAELCKTNLFMMNSKVSFCCYFPLNIQCIDRTISEARRLTEARPIVDFKRWQGWHTAAIVNLMNPFSRERQVSNSILWLVLNSYRGRHYFLFIMLIDSLVIRYTLPQKEKGNRIIDQVWKVGLPVDILRSPNVQNIDSSFCLSHSNDHISTVQITFKFLLRAKILNSAEVPGAVVRNEHFV